MQGQRIRRGGETSLLHKHRSGSGVFGRDVKLPGAEATSRVSEFPS